MSPSTNIRSGSTYNITIFTEDKTVTPSPVLFVSKYHFDTALQSITINLKKLDAVGRATP